ncbi:MAG: hypothetical protein OP8BY_0979 [Candidatus Saccharicenans subterraneus]|uniref:Uncharacterized protein n=1 Tax=Candidatus Saccharicenans subterraneus TaxID=2508984 RepID=A0A3E2BQW6_9BACT|nr:MAG: hypothetical protein OP8BY_0979 [Candidatus Saccharicenans subterraneum]
MGFQAGVLFLSTGEIKSAGACPVPRGRPPARVMNWRSPARMNFP